MGGGRGGFVVGGWDGDVCVSARCQPAPCRLTRRPGTGSVVCLWPSERGGFSMKRFVVAVAAAGAFAVAPASALGDASSPPNCFGQGAAGLGQSAPGAVGTFASTAAQGFKG